MTDPLNHNELNDLEGTPVAAAQETLRQNLSPPRRHWSLHLSMHGLRLFAEIAGIALLALGLLGTGLLWLFSQGPIKSEFVTRQIAAGIESRLPPGYSVALSSADLSEVVGGLHLHVDGFVVRDETGKPVIVTPRAEIGFDGLSLFLGRLVPRDIDLSGLLIAVTIKPDGSVAISEDIAEAAQTLEQSPAPVEAFPSKENPAPLAIGAFMDALSARSGPLGILERATLRNGILRIDDQRRGRSVRYRNMTLTFDRPGDALIELAISAEAESGKWSANAVISGKANEARRLSIKTTDLRVAELLGFAERGSIPIQTDMPLSLEFLASVDGKSQLTGLSGSITGGQATIVLDDPKAPPIHVDGVKGEFSLSDDGNRIIIPLIEFIGGETHWRISGDVRLPRLAADGWDFVLRSGGATVMADAPGRNAIAIDSFALNGTITTGFKAIRVDALDVQGPDLDISGNALIGAAEGRDGLRLFLKSQKSSVLNLLAFWPSYLVPEVRSYLGQAVESGTVSSFQYALDLDPKSLAAVLAKEVIPDSSVKLDLAFKDGVMRFDKGLPRIVAMNGTVHVTGQKVGAEILNGSIELPEGHMLAIKQGTYRVPDTSLNPAPADINFRIEGPASNFATAMQAEMLKSITAPSLDPTHTSGDVGMNIQLHFPQKPDLKPNEIQINADGIFHNLTVGHAFGREPLENGTVHINAGPEGLIIKGEGLLAGAPSQFELQQPIGSATQNATISMVIDDALREKKQMRMQGLLNGPVTLSLKLNGIGGETIRGHGDLDLTKASVTGLVPGWTRPSGKPGKANFNFALQPDQSIRLDNLVFDDASITMKGNAEISSDGELKSVALSQLRVASGDRVAASLERTSQGLRVKIQGETLDGRALIKTVTAPGRGTAASGQDIDLDLKVTTLSGFNNEIMTNADIRAQTRGGLLKDLRLEGKLGQQPVLGQPARGENGQAVILIQAADAGAILRFTDIYKRMNAGVLSLQIATAGDPLDGVLSIRNFAILDEEALAQLNTQPGTPNGKPIVTDPKNVQFTRLAALFAMGSGRMAIKDGVISGPVIGASIEGNVDYGKGKLDLKGAIVPAYLFNNLFNKLPIIGKLLGGENEGIFSINYHATGPITSPTLTYNPLSAVAPGFLRKLFDTGSQDPIKPPATVPK